MQTATDPDHARSRNGGRLRIVHAVRSDGFAGVERYIADVAAELARRDHDVVAIGGDAVSMRRQLTGSGVEHLAAAHTLGVSNAVLRRARGADIVHVHMTAAEAAVAIAGPLVRAPVVSTRHFARGRGSSAAARFGVGLVSQRVDAQISISEFVGRSIGEPSEVVLNGVPDAPAVDASARVVLVAQRLEQEKRTRDALLAWERSGLGHAGWQLWIAGVGAERDALESIARRRSGDTVRLLGHRPDLAALRSGAGIFLATAPAEPFGLSVAEAMAAGLPVVAAAGGGHLETAGAARPDLLYGPGSVDECAQRLRTLANDVELRRTAGAELRAFQQQRLSVPRHVDSLLGLYARVVANRRGKHRAHTPSALTMTATALRPAHVFPSASPRGGVERVVLESLRFLAPRHPTTFVGYTLDGIEPGSVRHLKPQVPWWGSGLAGPAAFRATATRCMARDHGMLTISHGVNAPPGDVYYVHSLHRAWLRAGSAIRVQGRSTPGAARYLLPRHQILLGLEWDYFRRHRPRRMIAVSDALADDLVEMYDVSREDVSVISNGFDPVQFNSPRRQALRTEERERAGIGSDAIVVLFVANELHRKGFGVLLDAVALVDDERLEIHVVGRTPLDDYARRISAHGLDRRVHYRGATDDVGRAHALADLFVLPTQYEPFGLAALEALASGLPVVIPRGTPGGARVRHDESGLLMNDPLDPEELAALLALATDAERRSLWSSHAPDAVAGLDWTSVMGRVEAVLCEIA